jgi:hypothetical protein
MDEKPKSAAAACAVRFVGVTVSAIIGAIRGCCFPRPRLRVGLESRVATPERRWNALSISEHVLNLENRVLSCQLSCQNGGRPSRASPGVTNPECILTCPESS